MNLLEYALRGMEAGSYYYDEHGNLYMDEGEMFRNQFFLPCCQIDNELAFISKEDCDKHREIEMIMPVGFEYDGYARRPYYRMRGKPVTQEQAFEIIRRTDSFFYSVDAVCRHDDYIGCLNFNNWLISKNHFPKGYGWIHADGTVGANGITSKYPTLDEFASELSTLICSFPFLDFVVALTDWNEIPPEAWDLIIDGGQDIFEREEYDGDFYKAVVMGIHVHDKAIEFLGAKDAVAKYKEYASLYEKDRSIYLSDYYQDNGIVQVDEAYLRRCIESYGLDAGLELRRVPEYEWKEVLKCKR